MRFSRKASPSLHDLSDPEYPTRLGFLTVPSQWWDIAVSGSTAYLTFHNGRVIAYDMSNPPIFYEVHSITSLEPPDALAFCDGILYAAGESRVSAIDLADRASPEILGEYSHPTIHYDDLECSQKTVYAAEYTSLQIFDFTDPAEPQLLAQVDLPSVTRQVEIAGDTAYVLTEGWITLTLHIIDIGNPANPVVINSWPTDFYADALGLTGSYLVGELASGPAIVDVSDPLDPQVVSQIPGVDWLEDLAIEDGLVYLAGSQGGLRIVDISDPLNPVSLSQTLTLGGLVGVEADGDSAYLIGFQGDPGWLLAHLDVSDPVSPAILSSFSMARDLRDVLEADGYVVVAAGGAGLVVFKEVSPAIYLPLVARH